MRFAEKTAFSTAQFCTIRANFDKMFTQCFSMPYGYGETGMKNK